LALERRTAKLPDGPEWVWEIKLDGYRALAVKTAVGGIALFSRRKISLYKKIPYTVEALADLPPGTVVDGNWSASTTTDGRSSIGCNP
jgi:ATP-dependent DNA ligase